MKRSLGLIARSQATRIRKQVETQGWGEREGGRGLGVEKGAQRRLKKKKSQIFSTTASVPEFDEAVPAGGGDFGGFVGMPESGDADFVMRLEFGIEFGGFPVPNEEFAVGVAGNQIRHIRRKVDAAGVAGHHVTLEGLLPVPLETV